MLGPLLFYLYIIYVRDALASCRFRHLLCADDLQIYVQVPRKSLGEGMALLEQAACRVSEWAVRSSLRLKAAKTKAVIFGFLRSVNEVYSLPV